MTNVTSTTPRLATMLKKSREYFLSPKCKNKEKLNEFLDGLFVYFDEEFKAHMVAQNYQPINYLSD